MGEETDIESLIPDPDVLLFKAYIAISKEGDLDWPQLLQALGASIPRTPTASIETINVIHELLVNEKFLVLEDSWSLMHFLLGNWTWLSPDQAKALREPIGNSFDRFANWMGAFIIGEILGEHYCDSWALSRLEVLAKSASLPARALVPHGLETLARTTTTPELRRSAIEALRALANDKDLAVRDEALTSLSKVGAILG